MQKIISKSELKAKMLEMFRQIEESGESLFVTQHGKVVLKIERYQLASTIDEIFGQYQGQMTYEGNLTEPTADEWGLI